VTGVRFRMWQAVGLSLLTQALLLIGPSIGFAQSKPQVARSHKRVAQSRVHASAASEPSGRCVHVIRRGDSLARVAARYRTTRQSLIAANPSVSPDRLRIGQRLQISGCRVAIARRHEEPTPAPLESTVTQLVARVGPRRVLTRLYLAVPDFDRATVKFQWPIEGPIGSGFGRRHGGWHAGIDILAEMGTPIHAAAAGTVIASGWERYYGRMIKIEHAGGFVSVYAHNLENLVDVGEEVEVGRVIGTVGRSGHASANHLHFEIRHDEVAYNPLHLLEPRDTPLMASAPTATLHDDDRE
jgi:lipoprotein NlpD